MPKLMCPCGHTINLSPLPNPNGLVFFSEPKLESLIVTIANDLTTDVKDAEATLFEKLPGRGAPQAYECDQCGRVAVFKKASDSTPLLWLRPESPDAPRLVSLGV